MVRLPRVALAADEAARLAPPFVFIGQLEATPIGRMLDQPALLQRPQDA
jgi:hypothetical protein